MILKTMEMLDAVMLPTARMIIGRNDMSNSDWPEGRLILCETRKFVASGAENRGWP